MNHAHCEGLGQTCMEINSDRFVWLDRSHIPDVEQ